MNADRHVQAAPPLLAVVVPCYNEQDALQHCITTLSALLAGMVDEGIVDGGSFLYFVDDGSTDSTWSVLTAARAASPRIRGLKLSRNFGHQNALFAGLMKVKDQCDISISIDADLQQDPQAMRQFLSEFRNGADVVFGVRRDRSGDRGFKKFSALCFYRLMTLMGANVIPNHADYRLLSRRAMEALSHHPEPNLFLRAICAQLGFRTVSVQFDVSERAAGISKYSLVKMLKLAIDGVTSFSVVPLRLIALVGIVIFAGSSVMSIYIFSHALIVGDTVPGWASTTLPIYFMGSVQILCLAVIGEYIAQILTTVKQRPRYIVDEELD